MTQTEFGMDECARNNYGVLKKKKKKKKKPARIVCK